MAGDSWAEAQGKTIEEASGLALINVGRGLKLEIRVDRDAAEAGGRQTETLQNAPHRQPVRWSRRISEIHGCPSSRQQIARRYRGDSVNGVSRVARARERDVRKVFEQGLPAGGGSHLSRKE
jgi:hypothetical protein